MKRAAFAASCGALLLAPRPTRADETPAPKDPLARAKAAFLDLQQGTLDRSALTPALSALLTDDVRNIMTELIAPYGKPSQFAPRTTTDVDGVATTVYRVTWTSGSVDFTFGIDDKTDKIAKLYIRPGPPPG
jgi:hypothetical protein